MSGKHEELFFKGAESWICDYYSISIQYVAYRIEEHWILGNASIRLNPLPVDSSSTFEVKFEQLVAGQVVRNKVPRDEIFEILQGASRGELVLDGLRIKLSNNFEFDYYSEMIHPDRWAANLHLRVGCRNQLVLNAVSVTNFDNQLRRGVIPFDGLNDLIGWLGLPDLHSAAPSINIWVNPPVDLIFDESLIEGGRVRLVLHAHPELATEEITIALRTVPGGVHESRVQVAHMIQWSHIEEDRQVGSVELEVAEIESVLVMVMLGEAMVRRQWLINPARAGNNKFVAFQHFDTELKMLRKAIIDPPKNAADNFEKGVAALLFLMGFIPSLNLEEDAPDILVATPSGRLVLVECTLRFTDCSAKVNKLVRRRSSLSRALEESGHYSSVECVLVCAIRRADTVNEQAMLEQNRVILVTRENLETELEQLRFPRDPDAILDAAIAEFNGVGAVMAIAGA